MNSQANTVELALIVKRPKIHVRPSSGSKIMDAKKSDLFLSTVTLKACTESERELVSLCSCIILVIGFLLAARVSLHLTLPQTVQTQY